MTTRQLIRLAVAAALFATAIFRDLNATQKLAVIGLGCILAAVELIERKLFPKP